MLNIVHWIANKFSGLFAIWFFDNRWQLFWNRLLFKKTGLTVYRYKDREFLVDHAGGDTCGTRMCLTSTMYKKYLPMMSLRQDLTVLDLGANGGGFPLMLISEGYKLKKTVCVEMNPQVCLRAQFNLSRNIKQSKVINAAVCGCKRNFELLLGNGSTSDTIYQTKDKSVSGKTTASIPGITLDDISQTEFPPP